MDLHNSFAFHRAHLFHDRFEVAITDETGPFVYKVRGWTNLIKSVEAFTETIAMAGLALVAKVHLYQTGKCELNGYTVEVIPLPDA
ncbi:hypothetical protein AB0E08_03705 [Streptomyces sp. NPDC048281]|uniref:hypothetical protein n=1 Tax=Streptomyces sp. NPDC048281 TaxID=3154715 RepID=UPI00342CA9D8